MSLTDKTKTALDELRMLILGAQILLGFQFQAPFQDAFSSLSFLEKGIEVIVLCLMVMIIGLLITPSARHRIVERGEATSGFNGFVTRISLLALAPFALALGLDIGVAVNRGLGLTAGVAAGLLGGLAAIGLWYGPLLRDGKGDLSMATSDEKTPTVAKIDYVLTEARVVLPGAQALLGFQLAIVLTSGFADLSTSAKAFHCVALGAVALATILLVTPAAYHRIVYDGSNVAEFYHIASRFLLAATVFLALGLTADVHVVIGKVTQSQVFANATAAVAALMLFGFWHLWPWWKRVRRDRV
ncbi:DUF6328 family protein [Rhizobium sp. R693]|uniref:DUF6328 family protein n=1 Tax=Rhizobium sp. R693 TaxID=1764276 RepID=UPI000B52C1A7|nr:DUF6328 family protein [Rhizobium sp. R693]OWV97147.1 hypothetical protein ATY79_22515 [Rhizobium sp. R693]